MAYFTNFPTIGYTVNPDTVKIVKAKNIIARVKFSDYVKQNDSLFFKYSIRDGDRPDTIANTVYNRPDLHWFVLVFNEIINPYHEWPLTQNELELMVDLVYPGTTLYVRDLSVTYERGTIPPNIPFFEEGSTISQNGITATVVSYNSNLSQLIVKNIQGGSFSTTSTNANGDISLGRQITQTNSLGNSISATITKSELTPYAVHHFEDSNGDWLDPICKFAPPIGATTGVAYRPYSGIPKSLINLYADPATDTLGNPIGEAIIVATQAISNMNNFYSENEKKREINILKPQFLDDIIRQFNDLFKTQ